MRSRFFAHPYIYITAKRLLVNFRTTAMIFSMEPLNEQVNETFNNYIYLSNVLFHQDKVKVVDMLYLTCGLNEHESVINNSVDKALVPAGK